MQLTNEQITSFETAGFLVLPAVFTDEEVGVFRAEAGRLMAEDSPQNLREAERDVVRNVLAANRRSAVLGDLARDPRLAGPARQLLGEDFYLQQCKINPKEAFDGGAFAWHQDFATHSRRDGVTRPVALNVHVFLDTVTEFNGPLAFVPGSHRCDVPAEESVDGRGWSLWTVPRRTVGELVETHGMTSATGPRGTLLIFGDAMVHVSSPNISPFSRWIYSAIYNPISNRKTTDSPYWAHEDEIVPIAAPAA